MLAITQNAAIIFNSNTSMGIKGAFSQESKKAESGTLTHPGQLFEGWLEYVFF